MGAREALDRLREGNQRFVDGTARHGDRDAARRQEIARGQTPWAMVLGCADSRVPPELVFDVGLGELFVVRVAGNVATAGAVGSLELGAAELGCPLLVVLGHHGCGCAHATLDGGLVHPGKISELTRRMSASIANPSELGDDPVNALVVANVRRQVDELRRTQPILAARVADGALEIVGAVYELDSGRVRFVGEAGAGD